MSNAALAPLVIRAPHSIRALAGAFRYMQARSGFCFAKADEIAEHLVNQTQQHSGGQHHGKDES